MELIFDDSLIVEEYKDLEVVNTGSDYNEEEVNKETIDDWIDLK